ncbi:PBD-domain-containing protein [Sesbania bispinosa]|nr:PBD-domain-containing protein [Sesbania bispinosa]
METKEVKHCFDIVIGSMVYRKVGVGIILDTMDGVMNRILSSSHTSRKTTRIGEPLRPQHPFKPIQVSDKYQTTNPEEEEMLAYLESERRLASIGMKKNAQNVYKIHIRPSTKNFFQPDRLVPNITFLNQPKEKGTKVDSFRPLREVKMLSKKEKRRCLMKKFITQDDVDRWWSCHLKKMIK